MALHSASSATGWDRKLMCCPQYPSNYIAAQEVSSAHAAQDLNSVTIPVVTSTINATLEDTGTVMTTQVMMPMLKSVYPLPDQTPKQMMERLFSLPDNYFTWNVSAAASTTTAAATFDIYHIMLTQPFIANIVKNFQYFRSDIEIHFRLNTNQFYSGALMFTAVPHLLDTTGLYQQARSWLKPKVLSAQQQDTIVMQIPWANPQRFVNPLDITTGDEVLWNVYVDILAPLIVASPNAPESIVLTIQARFVNPQLLWPVAPSSSRVRPQSDLLKKAAPIVNRIKSARGNKAVVHVSKSKKSPAAEAESPTTPSPTLADGTLTTIMNGCSDAMHSIVNTIQPLLPFADAMLAMLDKPEISDPVQRMLLTTAANCSTADKPDQSLPLTLYTPSYLNVDTSIVPDGGSWSILDVAMRPALHGYYKFTNTSALQAQFAYISTGTPMAQCIATHKFWRGSMRFRAQFFCSSFISGRIIAVYAPSATSVYQDISNNVTKMFDVKGDTTVDFTLPYIYPYDFCPYGTYPGTLTFSLYTSIATTDSSIDSSIQLVLWSAAGPDAQFSNPFWSGPLLYSDYPASVGPTLANKKKVTIKEGKQPLHSEDFVPLAAHLRRPGIKMPVVKQQCDIVEDFHQSFAPFVEGCEYQTDNRNVTSETTVYATDIMKRYQYYGTVVSTGAFNVGMEFIPNPQTLAGIYHDSFLFQRGGSRYKVYWPPNAYGGADPPTTIQNPVIVAGWYLPDFSPTFTGGRGEANIIQNPTDYELDVTVPWMTNRPFRFNTDDTSDYINVTSNLQLTVNETPVIVTMAARDDICVGFLVPPAPRVLS